MAKLRLDSLLSELGARKDSAAPPEPEPQPAPSTQPGLIDLNVPIDGPTPALAAVTTATTQAIPDPAAIVDSPSPEAPAPSDAAAALERASTAAAALSDTLSKTSQFLAGTGFGPGDIYTPDADDQLAGKDLKDILLAKEAANAKQCSAVETILKQSPHRRATDLFLEQGVDEIPLFEALAVSLSLPFRRLEPKPGDIAYDDKLVHRMTPEFCKENQTLPVGVEQGRVVLATSKPDDVFLIDEVKRRAGARSVLVVVVPPGDIKLAMAPLEAEVTEEVNLDEILGDIEEDDVRVEAKSSVETDLEKEAGESPVIRYVNYIIHTASKEGASDIHIEPGDKSLKVRFRIDGELYEMMQPQAKMAAAITSRLKIMANLDISERRLPQDGRIRCTVQNRKLDLRMSTLPSTYGEKVVLRILDTRSINVSLDDLGFDELTLTNWKHQIDQPHGIVLVTGPTGSGKTTTLYASLRQMDKKSMNISTVEDPVEYHLEGITQTQTHEKIGMTFARALKALLRQDPDVILVGEIRDQETAHTAVQAALTGHLVLSTLHTNDAPSSITRLVNIGLEPFLLGAAVNAALAQRLVRRVCKHCVRPAKFTEEMTEFVEAQGMDPSTLVEGAGCEKCRNSGHSGRLGIYELLCIDDHLRDIIARNPNVSEFRRMCLERGMQSLRQDGFTKAARGQTTVQEIIRATESAA